MTGPEKRGRVKGSVLQSRLAYVHKQGGAELLGRVLARLDDEERKALTGMLLPFAWYPFETNARLDVAIAAELGTGDATFRMLGEASARDNLASSSQRHYLAERNPHALLKHTSAIYSVYYDTGHRTYEKVGEHKAVLRTHASESYSREDCLTVVGWHEKAIEMCGGRNVRVQETQCRARGDAVCEYVCEWSAVPSSNPPRPPSTSSRPPR